MIHESRFVPIFAGIAALTLSAAAACSDDDSSGGGGGSAGEAGGGAAGATGGTGGGATGGTGGTQPDAASGGSGPSDGGDLGGGVCDMGQMCDFTCSAGCAVECLGGRCTASCDEGGCSLDADFEAVASYSCSGGGCIVDCDNGSECSVDCPAGGCDVTCDVDSRCPVSCGTTGEPCTITCVEGGVASCDTDNCTFTGCTVCDPTPDPTYMPTIDPAQFTNVVDNPLFPLPVGATWVYEAPDEIITVTVTNMMKTVMGVDVVVVHDQVTTPSGDLIEDTYDWYAQDADGNVWYFGEETAEYVNGVVANTRGSWEAGIDGALPGIIMHASHNQGDVGTQYRQEYYPCEAEDMGEIMAINESVTVGTNMYSGCVRIRDFSPLDPTSNEYKTYCPDVGVVLVTDVATGEQLEILTMVTMP